MCLRALELRLKLFGLTSFLFPRKIWLEFVRKQQGDQGHDTSKILLRLPSGGCMHRGMDPRFLNVNQKYFDFKKTKNSFGLNIVPFL